jgi:hypothetical protein
VLREGKAHLGARAVSVIGQRLDQDSGTAGPIALEENTLKGLAVGSGAGAAIDRPLDVFLGHRGIARLLDRRRKRGVSVGVSPTLAGRDRDRPRQLAELLAAFGVDGGLLVFDRVPLRVS